MTPNLHFDRGELAQRIGIELATCGLTAANYLRVSRALEGWCQLEDASDEVRSLRMVKSPAEIAYAGVTAAYLLGIVLTVRITHRPRTVPLTPSAPWSDLLAMRERKHG